MTRASSRNVGKFYRTLKLSAKNLRLFHALISNHYFSLFDYLLNYWIIIVANLHLFCSDVPYPIPIPNTGYLIWHSLVDILAVYLVLYLWGGTLLSVTLTWIIAMVTSTINKARHIISRCGMSQWDSFLSTRWAVATRSHSWVILTFFHCIARAYCCL